VQVDDALIPPPPNFSPGATAGQTTRYDTSMTTDEEHFADLEQEMQLGLAELRECVSRKQPLSVQSAVQEVLKDLDRNVSVSC
jgi:hypothetical protein